jgi:Fe2+ transport system protein FeoA
VSVALPRVALAELKAGETATVVAVDVPGEVGERLMEMGVTPGTQVTFVRRGLWGDPIQIRVRGFMLTLRRAQAREIQVTR